MKPVRVNRDQLLASLKANREAHHAIFLEAVEGYRAQALAQLEDHVKRVRKMKASRAVVRIQVYIDAPVDHTKDYDSAIGMLEMSLDETIEIDETTYRQFVLDDWAWKEQFLTSNSYYSATAAAAIGG